MRLSLALPALLATSVLAGSRHASRALSSRQAQAKRGLVDVCAALDLDLELLDILNDGKPLVAGHLDLCLCISLLPDFVKTNSVAKTAVLLLNETRVIDILDGLIHKQSSSKQCAYPAHAKGLCSTSNICQFECEDGYTSFTPAGGSAATSCTCAAPNTECNGKCGHFPSGCSSQAATKKRSLPKCDGNKQVCGILGGSKGKGWECVDVQSDLESCGGCMIASPFDTNVPAGVDCSAIPNVASVSCNASKCAVKVCNAGFQPSSNEDSCIPLPSSVKRDSDIVHTADAGSLVADVEGLVQVISADSGTLHVGRDGVKDMVADPIAARDIDALGAGKLAVVVPELVGLDAADASDVHVARDIDALDAGKLATVVPKIVSLGEADASAVHVARQINASGANKVVAVVPEVVALGGASNGSIHVARDIDAFGTGGLNAVVPKVVSLGSASSGSVHVVRQVDALDSGA